jgi:hypothetical protein
MYGVILSAQFARRYEILSELEVYSSKKKKASPRNAVYKPHFIKHRDTNLSNSALSLPIVTSKNENATEFSWHRKLQVSSPERRFGHQLAFHQRWESVVFGAGLQGDQGKMSA